MAHIRVLRRSLPYWLAIVALGLLAACGSNNNGAKNAALASVSATRAATGATTPAAARGTVAPPTAAGTTRPSGTAAVATSSGTPASGAALGAITVYAALTQANADAIRDAYQKLVPGATVNFYAAGTGAITSKLAAEERAGGILADVVWLADPTAMQDLAADNRFVKFTPNGANALPKEDVDPQGYYTGIVIFNNVIAYNTKSGAPKPSDWGDLTNAAYQGKIEIGDPAYSGTTFIQVAALTQKQGADYFKTLKQRGASVVQSTNTVGTDVASGQDVVGITLDSVVRPLVQKGSPIELVWPASGAIPVPGPAAVVKGSKHDAAAKAFIEWLLSPAGQQLLVSLGYSPVSSDAAAGVYPPGLHAPITIDLKQALDQKQQILDSFASIFPR